MYMGEKKSHSLSGEHITSLCVIKVTLMQS